MAHARINLQRMLSWIEERLAAEAAMPSDAEIGEKFGFASPEAARTLLAELADAGKITIRSWADPREIVLGRQPRRGDAPARPAPAPRRPDPDVEQIAAKLKAMVRRAQTSPSEPPPPPSPAPDHQQQETRVPNPPPSDDFRNINVLARGAVLDAIVARSQDEGTSLSKAAATLIEQGLAAAVTPPAGKSSSPIVDLSVVPADWLTSEIVRRLSETVPSAELQEALAAKEEAEAKLAAVRERITSLSAAL